MRYIILLIILFYFPIWHFTFTDTTSACCSEGVKSLAFSTIPSDIFFINKEIDEAMKQKDYRRALELHKKILNLCEKKSKEEDEIYYYYYLKEKANIAALYHPSRLNEPQKALIIHEELKKDLYPIIGKVIDNDMPYLGNYMWTLFNRVQALWRMGEKEKAREAMREAKKEIDALLIKYFGSADYELLKKQSEEGKLNVNPVRIRNILKLARAVSIHAETNMKVFEERDEEMKKAREKFSEMTPTDTITTPTVAVGHCGVRP